MATQQQETPAILHDLIERFERNIGSYLSPAYNETQVRREFIDPFFEALGWDMWEELFSKPPYFQTPPLWLGLANDAGLSTHGNCSEPKKDSRYIFSPHEPLTLLGVCVACDA